MFASGRNRREEGGGPLGKLVQGAAAGVGLASESIQHHKEKKRARKQQEEDSSAADQATSQDERECGEDLLRESDEAVWQLDEAQEDLAGEANQVISSTPGTPGEVSALADDFIRTHRSVELPVPRGRLDLPVVITQRRPKARTRGFIQAYAPLLSDVGIDQPEFLDFIDKLNKAVQPNPWLQAINLASLAAQHVPEPVTLAISIATKMAADAASEIHSRTKTNGFLDKINEEYFKPKGLVALLMTWKPQDPSVVTTADFDLGSTVVKPSTGSGGMFGKIQNRMKSSSAATSFEFPETAPLVFPGLDELASPTPESPETEAKKQNAIKRSGSFLTEYIDRRAVAKWAGDHPESKMANLAPKPEFRSRYADPSHPASSGDLLAFVTGGKASAGMIREQVQGAVGGRAGRGSAVGVGGRGGIRGFGRAGRFNAGVPHSPLQGRGSPVNGIGPLHLIGGVKKLLQKDVLYLMIVNRPSDEEVAEAASVLG
ncbi:hypothetical protein Daus18300_005379 [Diaporthe australafricana]|uniref:Uncharacterized protein n=1 Tax=Diaporthe australafricana TaxID=127596 RepID=A0ABR3X220_9PEZI